MGQIKEFKTEEEKVLALLPRGIRSSSGRTEVRRLDKCRSRWWWL